MVYEPGQVKNIFPYITPDIEYFVLAGPADGDEAQVFHGAFPQVKILGLEPCRNMFEYQTRIGFPGVLLPYALTSQTGLYDFYLLGEDNRSSRLEGRGNPAYTVEGWSLDDLMNMYHICGPTAIWMDIERAELGALRGAEDFLFEGYAKVLYLEAFEETIEETRAYLHKFYLMERDRLNVRHNHNDVGELISCCFDVVFTLEK